MMGNRFGSVVIVTDREKVALAKIQDEIDVANTLMNTGAISAREHTKTMFDEIWKAYPELSSKHINYNSKTGKIVVLGDRI